MLFTVGIVFLLLFVYHTGCYEKQEYRIGGLFNDINQEMAFQQAAMEFSGKYYQIKLVPKTINISIHDTLETYKGTCTLLKEGIIGLFGPSSTYSSPYVQSLCDLKEIPHIETHEDLNLKRNNPLVNIYPHPRILPNIFIDLIKLYNWHRLIILYDNDQSLLSVGSLVELSGHNHRTVVLRQLESNSENDSENYRPVLTDVKLTGETKYILACSVDILGKVLMQLQQVGMMTETYSYIITNLDMQTVELLPFQYSGTNITGIRMFNPDDPEVIRIAEEIENRIGSENYGVLAAWKLRLHTALIIDAVQLFFETIHYLTEDKKMSVNAKPLSCNSDSYWADGYTIINLMKTKSFHGLTGPLKFDFEGFRKDFNLDVLELRSGGLLKVGIWNSTTRTIKFQRSFTPPILPRKEENLFNKTFTVLISISPPYAFLKETTTQLVGNDRYEGYCVDVIEKLSQILGFNYTFIIQEDGANGNFNREKREWNGMIREVIDGRADLAITDLTITSEREGAVDFTMPFMNLGISILYRKPEPVPPSLFMFASPFSLSVWIMLGVSYFIVSLAFFVMGRLSPTEWQNPYPCVEEPEYLINQFTVRNSLWFTIGALMQQGSELAPIALSTRTASGIWWFFVLIMVSSYTANLAAFLTVETLVTPFKNIGELANQSIIKFGAKKNGATFNYFKDSDVIEYHKIWQYMIRHPDQMTNDNDEGVRKVEKENYAFLMESTTIEYITERHCSLAQVGGLLDDKGYGIAMKKDSPYRNDLSTAVLKLQETGVLTSLKIKWWKEKRGGGKCSSKSEGGEATPLDLQNVGGVFLVLSIGAILGIMGSFLELALHVHRKSREDNLSFKEEFKKQMKFFVQFKKFTKEINTNTSDANKNQLINNDKYSI